MKRTLDILEIEVSRDERFSITLSDNKNKLHFNFCDWLILGFSSENNTLEVKFSLISDYATSELELGYDFSNSNINSYYLYLTDIKQRYFMLGAQRIRKDFIEKSVNIMVLSHLVLEVEN